MAYIIWNRDTSDYKVVDDYYQAQTMAQRLGGNVTITKDTDVLSNPEHPMYYQMLEVEQAKLNPPPPTPTPSNPQEQLQIQQQVDENNALVARLQAQHEADKRRNAAIAASDEAEQQRWYDQTMGDIESRVALGQQQADINEEELARHRAELDRQRAEAVNQQYADNLAREAEFNQAARAARPGANMERPFQPTVPELGAPPSIAPTDPIPEVHAVDQNTQTAKHFDHGQDKFVTSPVGGNNVENEKVKLKEQLGLPKTIWDWQNLPQKPLDWDNPDIRTYSTYMDGPKPQGPAITPYRRPPPDNIVKDGYGQNVMTSSGPLRHRTDEEILRDEENPYWWM